MRFAMILACAAACLATPAREWQPLRFTHWEDLEPLTGEWAVEGEELVGRAPAGEMAWLASSATWADFELEAQFKTPRPCNGGIQVRSHWLPALPVPEGVSTADAPRTMYGYQANIETRSPEGTGGLVDENGRGHLTSPAKAAQEVVRADGWNTMRVIAKGSVIEVTLNGVTATRVRDEHFLRGRVGFQVMPMEGGVAEIRYRKVRIRNLGRLGDWQPLFNGENLDGWTAWGTEEWSVEDGAIVGRSGPDKSEGYLATEGTWKDFRARGRFRMLGQGNFGLFYRSTIRYDENRFPRISGIQGEVAPGVPGPTGLHYESYRRGWIPGPPDLDGIGAYALREGEWNTLEIRCVGNRTTSWVNGIQVIDWHDPAPQVFEGGLALQLHAGGVDGIAWKDLSVLEWAPAAGLSPDRGMMFAADSVYLSETPRLITQRGARMW